MDLPINKILNGDCLEHLKDLPKKSINMCMTSPPYWALRDYGVDNQLGLEPTFDEYIKKLCDIFDEVKRVLRDDGTCWVNIGDSYVSNGSIEQRKDKKVYDSIEKSHKRGVTRAIMNDYPSKCLALVPFRFSIEMVNRGWILRNTIIWHKRNCMPSSVKDRFTVDFEYLFLFSKKKNYYFEQQFDKAIHNKDPRAGYGRLHYRGKREGQKGTGQENFVKIVENRNKRTVWTINPKPFKDSHFAVYPEELCETPIKAGCPKFVCVKCGKAREKIYERIATNHISREDRQIATGGVISGGVGKNFPDVELKDKGYTNCNCNAEFNGGIVLDPFFGAGTTGVVALKQSKKFIGIELNPEYIEIAKARLKPYLEQRKLI